MWAQTASERRPSVFYGRQKDRLRARCRALIGGAASVLGSAEGKFRSKLLYLHR